MTVVMIQVAHRLGSCRHCARSVVHYLYDFMPLDVFLPPPVNVTIENHFSDSYYTARAVFRARARAVDATHYALPLNVSDMDLTIDVAVVPGVADRVVLHISGTHGIEGFVGSAIQSAVLAHLAQTKAGDRNDSMPTLVFVLALNPYGLAMLRRFIEHNVVLNRNFMSPEQFAKRRELDPNAFGYVDVMDRLNPTEPSIQLDELLRMEELARFHPRAAVNANYAFPVKFWYGGAQLEPSLVALRAILLEHVPFASLQSFGVLDVHTGLGPAGYDTLASVVGDNDANVARAFGADQEPQRYVSVGHSDGDVLSGYDGVAGFLCQGLGALVTNRTRELGTLPPSVVFRALIEEHAVYYKAPQRRLPMTERAARRLIPSSQPRVEAQHPLSAAFTIQWLHDFGPMDAHWPPAPANASAIEGHFSTSYFTARALFRRKAAAVNAELFALPIDNEDGLDLTIDVAIVRGSNKRALIHISGTHGVEGFAGSGIQSAILDQLARNAQAMNDSTPTLVLVHALNPFGFAQLRRFNEHNVDLNRNFLTPDEFAARMAIDPNTYGYMDVYNGLNPKGIDDVSNWFFVNTGREVLQHGFGAIKRAAVSGNYHAPEGIFYGGNKLQPSLVHLQQFVHTHLSWDSLEHVGIIDVHTGLGPAGYDTLILKAQEDKATAMSVFAADGHTKRVVVSGDEDNDAARGYDGATGFLCNGLVKQFPAKVQKLCLTQEFGTVSGLFVLKALIDENAVYHHSPTRRLAFAEKLRDTFYLHKSFSWKRDVVQRGLTVLKQLSNHLQQ
ncbi:TPA: hypothetical protein N0F65_010080 [Lagenidium giganteum]|uniref:DUF2817 domain-containing protein n=1 Tax=Lagenidium giganteum TaxID=4803 RepID=A0AAV2ZI18_9STRA|nr:TPA: hypothetical protein N0F65_010080 [Lagenidium giganteum]